MNLGDKIKKYRVLRGLTQTKLGEMVGFSRTTANSRIRKYETNEMAPKADIRQKIALALNVDMSALSDIDIQTEEDIMQVLFYLEETKNMSVERTGNKINLSFDCDDSENAKLLGYLCSWASVKSNTVSDEASLQQYNIWKAQFPMDINAYLDQQLAELNSIYIPLLKKNGAKSKFDNMADFMASIRVLTELGIRIKADHVSFGAGDGGIMLQFPASQIIDANTDVQTAFANFLSGLNSISIYCRQEISPSAFVSSEGTMISYVLRYSPFSGFQKHINEVQSFVLNKDSHLDWEYKNFESAYKMKIEDWKQIRFV